MKVESAVRPQDSGLDERREQATAVAVLSAALLAFFWPLATDAAPYYRDLLRTYYPIRSYMAERLRSGALPQWYPFENLGEPFIGQVVGGTFHPFSLIYLVFSVVAALKLELLLSYAFAASGGYRLARAADRSRQAAVVCGLSAALCGYAMGMSNNLPYLRGLATLPWLSWAVLRCATSPRPLRWVGPVALLWASIALGGDLQTFVLAGLLALAALASVGALRRVGYVVLAGALGSALTAIELVPAYFARSESIRAGSARTGLAMEWALHPTRIPEFVLDGYIPDTYRGWLVAHLFGGGTAMWSSSIFFGSVVLALAIWGGVARPRSAGPWLAASALGIWLATGAFGGLLTLLFRVVPFIDSFRFPEKYLVVAVVGFSISAAYGADALFGLDARKLLRSPWWWPGIVVLTLFGLVVRSSSVVNHFIAGITTDPVPPDLISDLRSTWSGAAFYGALFLLVAAGAAAVSGRRPALKWLLPVVVLFQLYQGNSNQLPLVPAELITSRSALCASAHAAGAGLGTGRLFPAAHRGPPSTVTLGDGPLWTSAMVNLMEPDTAALCGLEVLGYNLPALPTRYRLLLGFKAKDAEPYLPLFNVPLITYDGPPKSADEKVVGAIPDMGYVMAARPSLARAYLAVPRWVPTLDDALKEIRANPGLAVEHPVLEGRGPEVPQATALGKVLITKYEPESVRLEADVESTAALVLNDLLYPGWTATVDGAPAEMHPANVLARGMVLAPGHHVVEFHYRTHGLAAGAGISGGAALLLALVVLADYLRSRRLKMAMASEKNATTNTSA